MKLITRETLNSMKACREAIEWFTATFPNGTDLRTAWDACPHHDWRIWFTVHSLPRADAERLGWRFAGQAFHFASLKAPSLAKWAYNVTPANWSEARAAARAASAADAAVAYAAARAAYADARAASAAAYAATYAADAQTEQAQWCAEALGITTGEAQS